MAYNHDFFACHADQNFQKMMDFEQKKVSFFFDMILERTANLASSHTRNFAGHNFEP